MLDLNEKFYGDITNETIIDLLTVAFEGGSDYWLSDDIFLTYGSGKTLEDYKLDGRPCWYLLPVFDGYVSFTWKNDDHLDMGDNTHDLDRIDLLNALETLEKQWPGHFADIVEGQDDAETADLVLQLAVLGEVTFG